MNQVFQDCCFRFHTKAASSHSAIDPVPTSVDVYAAGHLGELTQVVPPEMIDAALDTTAGLSVAAARPSGSAVTEALRRVGPKPLRELFKLLAAPAVCRTRQAVRFAGWLVVAIDGTQIAVPDTEANRERFPKPRGGPNGQAGYPVGCQSGAL